MNRTFTDEQLEFLIRVVEEQDVHDWHLIKELFEQEFTYCHPRTPLAYEKSYYRYRNYDFSKDSTQKAIKEKWSAQKRASKNAKYLREVLEVETQKEEILSHLDMVFSQKKLVKYKPSPKKKNNKKSDNTLIIHLSDTHFGLHIRPTEVNNVNLYNWEIAAKRLSEVYRNVENIDTNECILLLNGDILQGCIHACNEWTLQDLMTRQVSGTIPSGISHSGVPYSPIVPSLTK